MYASAAAVSSAAGAARRRIVWRSAVGTALGKGWVRGARNDENVAQRPSPVALRNVFAAISRFRHVAAAGNTAAQRFRRWTAHSNGSPAPYRRAVPKTSRPPPANGVKASATSPPSAINARRTRSLGRGQLDRGAGSEDLALDRPPARALVHRHLGVAEPHRVQPQKSLLTGRQCAEPHESFLGREAFIGRQSGPAH